MPATTAHQSWTSPTTLARYTFPQFVSQGSGGLRSWLSPIMSTPIGLQFSYTAISDEVSLLRHEVDIKILVDGKPVAVTSGASSTSNTHSHSDFIVRNPAPTTLDRSVHVVITLTDILAGITHTTDFQLV
ncbi:hypothetical protein [Nocardia sp. CNY236]|uniref:hypothetical protein n=1 Tax=Nocardia sp. CNY236 TaxID=1169152 RepID=UPI0003F99BB6|nr:hypothetical protein [Nocardia sp. CNY236]